MFKIHSFSRLRLFPYLVWLLRDRNRALVQKRSMSNAVSLLENKLIHKAFVCIVTETHNKVSH
jgi:hypothetical protein